MVRARRAVEHPAGPLKFGEGAPGRGGCQAGCHRCLLAGFGALNICDMECERCHKPIPDDAPVYWARSYCAGYFTLRVCKACDPKVNRGTIHKLPMLSFECRTCQRPIIVDEFFRKVKRNNSRWFCSQTCQYRATRARPKTSHTCVICGATFEGRQDAKTCSAKCRKRLQRSETRAE